MHLRESIHAGPDTVMSLDPFEARLSVPVGGHDQVRRRWRQVKLSSTPQAADSMVALREFGPQA